MKTWNYHTHKGKRFFRSNHAELSKDKFFLMYYRILHTAYLNGEQSCINSVKQMCEESFGAELNTHSIAYITNSEPCFVNDTVVELLNNSGKFFCPECLKLMLIEIGFDVYLMQTIESNKVPNRKAFYRWLPLKKGHNLKKMIKNFWKERLPKEKFLTSLYYLLENYKNGILATYRKLLVENDIVLLTSAEKESILSYIDTNLAVQFIPEEVPEAEEVYDALPSESDDAEEAELETITEKQPELISELTVEASKAEQEFEELKSEPLIKALPRQQINMQQFVRTENKTQTVTVKKRRTGTSPDCRGFREKNNKMSRKKAVTCAVCVAAAGALLVPLVAYTVIKHKS